MTVDVPQLIAIRQLAAGDHRAQLARAAYPRNLRAQDAFLRGFAVEAGQLAPSALTGCHAEMRGRSAAVDCGHHNRALLERELATVAARLASPHRARAGAIVRDQADAAHLPLFIAANEPGLPL